MQLEVKLLQRFRQMNKSHKFDDICNECERKDDIISYQKRKIEELQKQIKSMHDKTRYLEKAKAKIAEILLKMKNEKLVDDEGHKQLQVVLVILVILMILFVFPT